VAVDPFGEVAFCDDSGKYARIGIAEEVMNDGAEAD
jgi:hypothetical protein